MKAAASMAVTVVGPVVSMVAAEGPVASTAVDVKAAAASMADVVSGAEAARPNPRQRSTEAEISDAIL